MAKVVRVEWNIFCEHLKDKKTMEKVGKGVKTILNKRFWNEVHDLMELMFPIFCLL